jgi:Zinc carboxypeptidase
LDAVLQFSDALARFLPHQAVVRPPGAPEAGGGGFPLAENRRFRRAGGPFQASERRLPTLAVAVLLAGIICGHGALETQTHEGPDDDSYVLEQIQAVGSPSGSSPGSGAGRIQQRLEASSPRTGFEQRKGSGWTTLAEEQRFLSTLDAASDRVRVSVLARTLRGRPIQLVVVGPPLTNSEIKTRGAILFVCTQHGNEPAGREACLQLARNHAATSSTATLLVIPTANPDGVAAGARANAAGTDINRDHARLETPEGRAISSVLRDFLPPLVSDMHEYSARGASRVLVKDNWFFPNADAAIAQQVSDANALYLIPDLNAAGFATGVYGARGTGTPRNRHEPNRLSAMGPLRHAPTMLVETPRSGTLSPWQRVRAQLTTTSALLRMWAERQGVLVSARDNAARRAREEGAAGSSRYHFTDETFTNTPPCGYQLSTTEYGRWKPRLGLFGVIASFVNGGWRVSMAQRTQPLLGLLLDSRAPAELVAGRPLPCPRT